ncbi:hypothetical protein JW979_04110 [bacterium]|nr:hypothetical protein [candidate division CSSED10-310 bacterium]
MNFISRSLLSRSGMIRELNTGVSVFLPLGFRVLKNIETMIRKEMDSIKAQEIYLLSPMIPEKFKIVDKQEQGHHPLTRYKTDCNPIAMPNEEVFFHLIKHEVSTHRKLPLLLHHFHNGPSNYSNLQNNLLKTTDSHYNGAFSLHESTASLDDYFDLIYKIYSFVFDECGVLPILLESSVVPKKENLAYLFAGSVDKGPLKYAACNRCSYAAEFYSASNGFYGYSDDDIELPLEEVETPGRETISEVADFLCIPEYKTIKAVFYKVDSELVFVAIRGDRDVNEEKLKNHLNAHALILAEDSLLHDHGIVPGYASPINLPDGIEVVLDKSLEWGRNYVAGANRYGFHLKNVNIIRDIGSFEYVDIGLVRNKDPCPRCENGILLLKNGVALAHMSKYNPDFTDQMKICFSDRNGKIKPIILGQYTIGLDRLVSSAVECGHDSQGICWPSAIAPFDVYLILLDTTDKRLTMAADQLYGQLTCAGIDTLYDERDVSAGVKFNDADLIGCPLRVTVSRRNLDKGSFEMKSRRSKTIEFAQQETAVELIQSFLQILDLEK